MSYPAQAPSALDVLFVYGTNQLWTNQRRFANGFDALLERLHAHGALEDVHIGVIDSDLGTGPFPIPEFSCVDGGRGGSMLSVPSVVGCTPPRDRYIAHHDSAPSLNNYQGTLAEAFQCIAMPRQGCVYHQSLATMRKALTDNQDNAGFLRPESMLVVVFFSDRDDCSARNDSLYDPARRDLSQVTFNRCFIDGVVCDPDLPWSVIGPRTGCRSRVDHTLQEPVGTYVNMARQLKPGRRFAAVGLLNPDVEIVAFQNPPETGPVTCSSAPTEGMAPAIRLRDFVESFAAQGLVVPYCASGAFLTAPERVGDFIATTLREKCLRFPLAQVPATDPNAVPVLGSDLRASCSASDWVAGREVLLPPCLDPDQKDCFRLVQDPTRCPVWLAPQGVNLIVERSSSATDDTTTELTCQQAE